MRVERVRYVERGVLLLACFVIGVFSAVLLAGCGGGGGGGAAGQIPSTGERASVSRPGATQTRDAVTETRQPVTATETRDAAATVAPTPPAATGEPIQPVATVTETRGSVTVNHVTSVGVTVSGVTPQTTEAATTVDTSGTPAWVWVLVAAGAGAVIALVVWLFRRGSNDKAAADRQRLVAATVTGWTAQGWAIESETESSAVLRQNGERLLVNVEPDGRISSRRLGFPSEPSGPGSGPGTGGWPDGA